MIIFDEFLLRIILAGIMFSAIAGVLGCFIVWRRMAYFGDSLAHSALLGITLGLAIGLNVRFTIILASLAFSVLLFFLMRRKIIATDTLLGILAHGALAIGILALAVQNTPVSNLHGYLFGDIVTVSWIDLWMIAGLSALVLSIVIWQWPSLVITSINEELARAEGVNIMRINLTMMILISLVVASAIKIVGVLLITALLIMPAATARLFSHSPHAMAIIAAFIGMSASVFGVFLSSATHAPTGPSIVFCALCIFILSLLVAHFDRDHQTTHRHQQ